MTSTTTITIVRPGHVGGRQGPPDALAAPGRLTARPATGARRRTAGPPRSARGRAVTVSWVADGVDENDVTRATGMSGGYCAFCKPARGEHLALVQGGARGR